ncbi:hypothetical protein [Ancylobacter terrae]|uniref:hypothetical protein n=1 Tax=Ancylobacter sp. sgz301288 TaxID=3342077 RepID=UPI00385C8C79
MVQWDGDHKDHLAGAFAADDPLYASARDAALKHGIPPKAFGAFLTDVFGPALANGVLPPPFNPQKQMEAWGQSLGITDKTELARQHGDRVAFASGLGKQLGLSDAGQVELDVLTDTAAGLEVIDKLRGLLDGDGIGVSAEAQASPGRDTPASLRAAMKDPRYDSSSPKYDETYRASVDARYKRHYG